MMLKRVLGTYLMSLFLIPSLAEPMKARLVNGTNTAGRLEIYYDGKWGTVCDDEFGKEEARVACRMLGFNDPTAAVVSSDRYGRGSGHILLDDVQCIGVETSLAQCSHSGLFSHNCGHSEDVGVICSITEPMKARLVNGTNTAGRLEIYYDGEWGTVCNSGFGKEEARVACRMLGFNGPTAAVVSSVKYGRGSGDILLDELQCTGAETSLAQCSHSGLYSQDCHHSEDVGVTCSITEPMKARLVNGTNTAGRLEIYYDGEWGTVCNHGFGKEEARVACRMLGFNDTEATVISSVRYGPGSGRILLDDLRCSGAETSLEQCSHREFYSHNCGHSEDIGVICNISEPMEARLVNGTNAAGRLEINYYGEWGTVCNHDFGKEEARVACMMLGFNNTEAAVVSSVTYGRGSGRILLDDLQCSAAETSLEQCSHRGFYSHNCGHSEDVGVICNIHELMKARLVNGTMEAGRLEIYFNGKWGTVCLENFGKEDAYVACKMLGFNSTDAAVVSSVRYGPGSGDILLNYLRCQGNETSLAQCDVGEFYPRYCNHMMDVSVACNITEPMKARLVNGTNVAGRLEINYYGEWGTVCEDEFGKEEAIVACRMLGFNGLEATVISSVRYGPGSGRILLDDVRCSGTETSLEQCSHRGLYSHDCRHSEDVGVICNTSEPMKARLVNGTNTTGRLEIYYNGEWGTVCNHGFGKEEARVACMILGLNSTEAAVVSSVRYGQGSGHILLDDVRCSGAETSLEQCSHRRLYSHNCAHSEDVSVICNITEPMKARLVNGATEAGRLELYFNGEWGTVCRNDFGKEDAYVACKMLGFNSTDAAVVSSGRYGPGSGDILLSNVRCQGNETSLAQCDVGQFYPRYCDHMEDVGVVCITELKARLTNGTMEAGRLEIYFNGEWGTVCRSDFGKEDAYVACKMLGFNSTNAAVVSSVRYGPGSGDILLSNVRCQGNETSLAQCDVGQFYPRYCSHMEDVGVACNITEPMKARLVNGTNKAGRLEINYYGEWGTVCKDGFGKKEARVACLMLGFNSTEPTVIRSVRYGQGSGHILLDDVRCKGAETSLAQCSHRGIYIHNCVHSEDVSVICSVSEPMKARLVSGTNTTGRLEIYYNGEWGTVCNHGFGKEEARVACMMLGFNSSEAAVVSSERYGQGSSHILLDDVRCNGAETSLEQCSHSGLYSHNCVHSEDVSVICVITELMKVRLVNGTIGAGRLEIYFNGEWGTVCRNDFGKEDAYVVCKMLGFNSTDAAVVSPVRYGPGSGNILFSNVWCQGNERSLAQCDVRQFYPRYCNHMEDVGVACNITEPMKARLVSGTNTAGRLEINYYGEWGTVCKDGFGKKEARVACLMLGFNSTDATVVSSVRYGQGSGRILLDELRCNGAETSLAQCSHPGIYIHNCDHSEDVSVICEITEPMKARLVNGTNTAGRLEINYNGEWGTVCNHEFGKEEARVACMMLGFNSTDPTVVSSDRYGEGSGRILLDDLRCSGAETSLAQCSHNGLDLHNCFHFEDVGVICNIPEPMKARLVNGTMDAGRLEIYFNGKWGTVCRHDFGKEDAYVVCKMLGFNRTDAAVISSVKYGPGSGDVLLSNVRCQGNETNLAQCDVGQFYPRYCNHMEDVGVACNITEPMKARLVNGTNTAGRLEIYYYGEWGTVCDDEFGKEEARVACMMLGFNGTEATVVSSVRYGQGSGRILLNDVRCSGAETSLEQCSHSDLYSHNCGHSEDVSVVCNISEPMEARLVNGTNTAGRLEIYYNGEWGTVCNHDFGKEEARVACMMLGFNNTEAAVVSSVRYGRGSGRILLNDVRCSGAETSLEQCSHSDLYSHNCGHSEDVSVVCNISEPMEARLVNGTNTAGRLEIYYNGEWGTVCNHDFGKEEARVACMMLGFNNTEAAVVSSVRYGRGSGRILLNDVRCSGAETSLEQCSHSDLYSHNCGHSEDVSVVCNISEPMEARLVNGTNTAGRLEIYYNGEWGTVCNHDFGKEEARVACMMLGFNNTEAAVVSSVRYGRGSGRILLNDVRCSGAETSLEQCSHSDLYSHNCGHSEDVSVVCNISEPMEARLVNGTNTAGRLEIYYNGEWGTVCNHDFGKEEARVACMMLGFNNTEAAVVSSVRYGRGSGRILLNDVRCSGAETSLEQCSHSDLYSHNCGHSEDVSVVCNISEPMEARLVNGTNTAGRLEIYYNGEWGTVCNHDFGKEEARVACMMLGFNNTEAAVVSSVRYGLGSGRILLDDVRCSGAETSLEQCSHRGFYSHNCGHPEDVSVVCNISEPMEARLVNGTNTAGRLEIYYNGEWGTVCNHDLGKEEARVACMMLGFNNTEAAVVSSVRYGRGSGRILLDDVRCSGAETSLEQCSHRGFYSHSCSHSEDFSVVCNISEPMKARLVNGTNTAGRLEINYYGEWGTVCNHDFGKEEARVACMMLGFNNTEAAVVSSVRYGRGSGRILLDDVRCSGAETSLEQCSHRGFYSHNCGHSADVGVICNINKLMKARLVNGTMEAGRLEIYLNGEWGTVCKKDFGKEDAYVVCKMLGFNSTDAAVISPVRYGPGSGNILLSNVRCQGNERSLAQCDVGQFYPRYCNHMEDVGVTCTITEPMKARLVNGTNVAGRLEINYYGEWGTVCKDQFGKEEAIVACRMLGFTDTEATVISSVRYGPGSGRILLDDVRCNGAETSLAQCSHRGLYLHDCRHSEDVGVICNTSEPMKARLVNGTNTTGRLEIYYNGEWGTVCNHGFGKKEARVACMILGLNSTEAAVVSSVRYGQGSGHILLDDVRCNGAETSLEQCSHRGLYSHNCAHSEDVCVICNITDPMKARLANGTTEAGRLELYFNGEWGTVCRNDFGKEDAYVACKMLGFNSTDAAVVSSGRYGPGTGHILLSNVRCQGNETSLAQCDVGQFYPRYCDHMEDVGVVCNITELKARLANGTTEAGRLEIYFNGEWGTVCRSDFGKEDAYVACKMLGFNSTDAAVVSSVRYGPGSGDILLSDVLCQGNERSLAQCDVGQFYPRYCNHMEDVGVACNITEPMKARLVNGTNVAGRLEINYYGEWGTVCKDEFGKEEARVACMMLGFNSTEATVIRSVRYGQGSGRILLDDVRCNGAETSLAQCSHRGIYIHNCVHSEDVSVICSVTEPMKARLVSGTNTTGRLEIYYNGEWGTVCNHEFGKDDARVACRMLGLNSSEAAVVSSDRYGPGSGHILLDDVRCSGAETSLAQCSHSGPYSHNCVHSEDVGVICITTEIIKARLVNGTMEAGRLEIFFNGEWGTVCRNDFGKEDAYVVCKMLGFNSTDAAVVSSVRYGPGSGNILLSNVRCQGNERSLAQCDVGQFYPRNCNHMEDVGVACNITEPMKARLVNETNTAGRLEINYYGEWGTVCNDEFGKEEAIVACRMLGFNGTEATVISSVRYGQGSGRILLDDVRCNGAETSLAQCSHRGIYIHNCVHSQDVSVICDITEPMKARLVNGTNAAGRLEIYYNGEWGTVCNHEFGKEEARVACMMLGFNSTEATVFSSVRYGQGSDRILLDDLRCSGAESSLAQCSHSGLYSHDCDHSNDVGVICNIPEPMKARLVNGTMEAGRLEIYFNGKWGTVCRQDFGKEDAYVVCKMLGFNRTDAAVISSGRYGPGSGDILLTNVRCQGNERSLAQCDVGQFYPRNCDHMEDVGVACNITEPMKARLVNGTNVAGRLEINYYGEWGTVCDDEFGKEEAGVACMMLGFNGTEATVVSSVRYGQGSGRILLDDVRCNGAENSLEQCSHRGFYSHNCGHPEDVSVVCNISEPMKARLVNGTNTAGRLEIYYNSEWGTVCNHDFGKEEARVACMMLGFNSTEAAVDSSVRYGQGSGRILLDDVRCNGAETNLEQCSHSGLYSHNCDHSEDVGVFCNINEPMKARLANGTTEAGRLEIYFNGEWGTVCRHDFGKEDAYVACKMLGFNSTDAAVVSSVRYGPGSSHILLSDVRCQGSETNLAQCDVGQFYPRYCNHMEDVGVVCDITEPIKARLVNGTNAAGLLEIYYNGEWGTVCDDRFGEEEAGVACRMLGFNDTKEAVVSSVSYGQGSGHILLDEVRCSGAETSLAQCSHRGLYSHDCRHSEDVSVICIITGPMEARLVNGTNAAGRLEINYNGEWGTVCDHEFGKEEARVACMMLGFNSTEATVVRSVRFGQGSGNILLDDVRCSGAETSLEQCSHPGIYLHNCGHSEDVGIICNNMEPMKVRLVNGSEAAGRLEIFFNGEWGTVCDDGFNNEAAQVACRMLGFSSSAAAAVSPFKYGAGRGHILLKTKYCRGTETSLTECQDGPLYPRDCSHSQDVGVVCNITEPIKARLVNGTIAAGRLEIYFNGEWGTVCNNNFGKEDAQVACRMLGFNDTEAAVVSPGRYGQGSGHILLSGMGCNGTETSLEQCDHIGFYPQPCRHRKDVAVICNITEPIKARLVNGTITAGRLEIYFNGEWGTVCNNNFGKEDAQVACRMLGFNDTEVAVASSGRYGQGSGHILLSGMGCNGTETSLEQCNHSGFYPQRCSHRKDVAVICNISVDTVTSDFTRSPWTSKNSHLDHVTSLNSMENEQHKHQTERVIKKP